MPDARRVVIVAPGRSGSTLLQSAFLASCDTLTFFEPCRHDPQFGDVRRARCVAQVQRFLECRLPHRKERWAPPEIRGWLNHPYRDANTSCAAGGLPFMVVRNAEHARKPDPSPSLSLHRETPRVRSGSV